MQFKKIYFFQEIHETYPHPRPRGSVQTKTKFYNYARQHQEVN